MENIRLYSDKIEDIKEYTNKARLLILSKKKKEKGIHSPLHLIVKEATDYFNEPKLFGRYLGFIKFIGIQEARKRLAEQKESNIKEPKYFFRKNK